MRSTSKREFQNFFGELIKEEKRQFVGESPILHRLSVISVTVLAVLALVGILAFVLSTFGLERWVDGIFMNEPVIITLVSLFFVSFFVSFLWFRSYMESYSSFQKYLRAKRRFYLLQKREMDRVQSS